MAGRLEGKVALITGGVSGMALGTVEKYVAEGARVVVADIQAAKGPALEARFPGNVYFSACDIREESQIARAVGLAEEKFGGLDILMHAAAAVHHREAIADLSSDSWDDGQANLLRSHVMCIKHAIPAMKKRGGGSIVLVSSAACNNFRPGGNVVYVVCKGAVLYLARWAAFELAKDSIRVNAIIPGAFATSLWGDLVNAPKDVADLMPKYLDEMMATWQPLPKAGAASDIANAAIYLGSDESVFVTGVELEVDGGLSLHRPVASKEDVQRHLEIAKRKAEGELVAINEQG